MKTIHKYPIPLQFNGDIGVPKGAQLLDIQNQNDSIEAWFIVDTKESRTELFGYYILGTGGNDFHRVPNDYRHIKTVQIGSFVWHIFMHRSIVTHL